MKRKQLNQISLTVFFLASLGASRISNAFITIDNQPALMWDQLLHAKLVVVATAEPKSDTVVTLHIQKVLRGDAVKADTNVDVPLAHWYSLYLVNPPASSIDSGPVPAYPERKDQIIYLDPRLIHTVDTGSSPEEHYGDMRKPAVYFFPGGKLTLDHFGQIQFGEVAADWEAALKIGGEQSIYMRIAQNASEKVRQHAIAELHKSRDPKTIERLLAWMFDGLEPRGYGTEDYILIPVGDVKGDLTGP